MNKSQRKSKITEPEIEKFQSEIKSDTKWKNNLQEQQRRTSWKSEQTEQVRPKKIKKTREKKKGSKFYMNEAVMEEEAKQGGRDILAVGVNLRHCRPHDLLGVGT